MSKKETMNRLKMIIMEENNSKYSFAHIIECKPMTTSWTMMIKVRVP